VPVAIVCGRSTIEVPAVTVISLTDRVGERAALEEARPSLVAAAEALAARAEDLVGAPR
jgi:hypothetical protein